LARRARACDASEYRRQAVRAGGYVLPADEAKRLLGELLALNPPECRDAMLANVRLHREIAEAAKR
jgi:hypothetical protein